MVMTISAYSGPDDNNIRRTREGFRLAVCQGAAILRQCSTTDKLITDKTLVFCAPARTGRCAGRRELISPLSHSNPSLPDLDKGVNKEVLQFLAVLAYL